ncbi:uncharacterized protein Z519_05769 [Cladophialophora bantiana CBS 173.52]|uniref:DNA 3'-5' helicase n=1 Tax=Cladophialophora bantiana (strain ATCC 10958 / CBS 173.52 / CDC B-1940 / NIH 8579) TaxID=1442370 RepID=A0A0D2I8N5_CLAB1|nr:uncharacterized protein Z519_05769 [Cladophialophora bantiana CBS 173.52]KIW93164.1 hypothetical protein Z519_05769 [Cladophialophora bantiana CBS 173.52]
MDGVRRLPAGYRRDSSYFSTRDSRTPRLLENGYNSNGSHNVSQRQSPYFAPPKPVEAGLFDPHPPPEEVERAVDDFDRTLLEKSARGQNIAERSGLTRISLPRKPLTPLMTGSTRRVLQDDLHDDPILQATSSSSTALATSPTVSFLQNRRRHKDNPSVQSKTSTSRPNELPSEEVRSSSNISTTSKRASQRLSLSSQPVRAPPVVQGIQLVPTAALPDQIRSVFKFEIFNAIQSKCFESAFQSDDNVVVSAPTGSGKTVVMELAICRLVAQSKGQDFKVVYQGPTKSLCSERYRDWETKFGALDLRCAELTGDSNYSDMVSVQKASIIITTPEKWDSVTRKWKDHAKLMQLVKLFLVDEVHILKDERGATLETVVSRMKSVNSNIRFVALSATVPNSEDIAVWLGKDPTSQHLPAHREVFEESFRPVQLKKHVYGFDVKSNDFAFDSMLTHQIPEIIAKHGLGKPVMIFCPTRRASVTTAKVMADTWSSSNPAQRPWSGPGKQLTLTCPDLKTTSVAGVAFHHGGLSASDRHTIENAFLNGQINIICSTSTLAVGVNLPCYLVILKGTKAWTNNGFKEYADLEVMQMLGRAGRPQFETSACAVILTRKEKVARYEKMVSGEELLESCLHQNLIEHLNAEVVLGTVHDIATAKQWLASTFFYVRLKRNPSHYQIQEGVKENTEDDLLEQLCKKDLALLLDAGLIEHNARLTSTLFGEAMARYYVGFDTMKSFMRLPPKAKMSEILSVLAQAKEFREVRMLAGEKSFYKEINKAPEIKFPIKVDVALPAHKISLLIQAELGNVALPDGEHHKKHHQQSRIDKIPVFAHANRLIRCIIDCQIHLEDAISTRHALELGRSLAARVWDNTASQLRQVEGLGEVAVRKLASASINSIDTLLNTEPSRIELVLGKNPPFGHQLLQKLESFPNLRVSVKQTARELRVGDGARIKMIAEIGFLNNVLPRSFNKKNFSVCFLAETSHGALMDFRRFNPKKLQNDEQVCLTLHLTRPTSHVNCYVMCDDIAGTSKYAQLSLSDIPNSVYRNLRARENMQDEPENLKRNAGASEFWDEDFDDGGVNDQDLLAVEADGTTIEVIEDIDDIDDILDKEDKKKWTKPSKQVLRQHGSENHERTEDSDVPFYRESIQLPSGRWTCQHDCNECGKKCKHRCCKEGVAKPRRRPKTEPKITKEEKGQKKITAVMKPKVEPAGGPKAKPESKHHTGSADVTKPVQESNLVQHRASVSNIPRNLSRSHGDMMLYSLTKHIDEPAAKKLKLSKGRETDNFEHPYADTDFKPQHSQEPANQGATETRKEHNSWLEMASDDFFALLSDGDDAGDIKFPHGELRSLDKHGPGTGISAEVVDKANGFSTGIPGEDWLAGHEEQMDSSTPDVDLGCFDAPLEHVTMSDVLKKGKCPATHHDSFVMPELPNLVNGMDFNDDFFLAPTDFGGFPMGHTGQVDDSVGLGCEAITSFTNTPVDSLVKTPEDPGAMAVPIEVEDGAVEIPCKESDSEREKRLYEEDQKKKWEGIDQWIYDEFHEYVELV